ncbi:MAG: HD domain-containing protein [Bradyrhizobium sp.]|uniref:HD domain-containing protein n=1 Tax=Bradyrhizobium sp. TaxID=376 RepID=UPI003D138F6F
MREIIAVCRSSKRSRVRVASVLDRYFWRIGDRTWRGRASNACLDRVARELRAEAKRNTAVVIHEIRSARESRVPIVRIGSRSAFSEEGVVPVVVRSAAAGRRHARSESEQSRLAIVRIAILFHDLGKATALFQNKLREALKKRGAKPVADVVRHELFSAVVWDELVGSCDDGGLIKRLGDITRDDIDSACEKAIARLRRIHSRPDEAMKLAFAERDDQAQAREGTLAHAIGMLILTHHRLPEANSTHLRLHARAHVNPISSFDNDALEIAKGTPFWHSGSWLTRLRRAREHLRPGLGAPGLDIAMRASLMFADHLGSALSQVQTDASTSKKEHLANTKEGKPADSLVLHIERVWQRAQGCFDMLHRHREGYPALSEDQVPIGIRHPDPAPEPFAWQTIAASATRALCEAREGGFFACLMSGTGTGKTRGAPTVLTAAAFADRRPERRYLRMMLALGLRSLATQSSDEYISDLGFDGDDVTVLIGQPPVRFEDQDKQEESRAGSESLLALPEWLRVERAGGGPPPDDPQNLEESEREADWLRRLSVDTDRGLPATLDRILEHADRTATSARRFVSSPIIVGTVDHIMAVASPVSSRYLFQALRVLTSDLILDEIDQYEPEDIAAIGRLVYQTAAAGRRVIIMSATLPDDAAKALFEAYRAGWQEHAAASGLDDHVNVLCSGDAPGSCVTNGDGRTFAEVYEACRTATVSALQMRHPRRRGTILPVCADWAGLVAQIDAQCSALHDATASAVDDLKVSVGFIRMTRISHTAALATRLPAGIHNGRLRLKVCLHSQFPRLHRAWIEREFKSALTRKGREPDAGLHAFGQRHGLFERARAAGCNDLEIIVVTSPVIETGNDLDFDWAILDPASMRAIVQAAGRVWRHRSYGGLTANVAILGRSAIVMQPGVGRLEKPGVETNPHRDTKVARVTLDGDRHLVNLAGAHTFDVIDACAILGPDPVLLREKEAELRTRMVDVDDADKPLGCYLRHSTGRLNRQMTRSRVFRRSTTRDLLYFRNGKRPDEWMLDLEPGTRNTDPRPAKSRGLRIAEDPCGEQLLFPNLDELAWRSASTGEGGPTKSEIEGLTEVRVPEYDGADIVEPPMTYAEFTGFTRGAPGDLFQPFGKKAENPR